MLMPGYDVAKAAQVVAFFALKSGGKINVLKVAKLLYLSEREFMRLYDTPMFYDRLVSMPDGPVTSITLNLINGEFQNPVWGRFVSPREGLDVSSKCGMSFEQLEDLSVADREILESLWEKFGPYDRFALRDWTHDKANIPEWEDPQGSAYLIEHKAVFHNLKKSDGKALEKEIENYRDMVRELSRPV